MSLLVEVAIIAKTNERKYWKCKSASLVGRALKLVLYCFYVPRVLTIRVMVRAAPKTLVHILNWCHGV